MHALHGLNEGHIAPYTEIEFQLASDYKMVNMTAFPCQVYQIPIYTQLRTCRLIQNLTKCDTALTISKIVYTDFILFFFCKDCSSHIRWSPNGLNNHSLTVDYNTLQRSSMPIIYPDMKSVNWNHQTCFDWLVPHQLRPWPCYCIQYTATSYHTGESLRFLGSDWLRNGSWARGSVPGGSATVSLLLAI